jgi:hypothetical protein
MREGARQMYSYLGHHNLHAISISVRGLYYQGAMGSEEGKAIHTPSSHQIIKCSSCWVSGEWRMQNQIPVTRTAPSGIHPDDNRTGNSRQSLVFYRHGLLSASFEIPITYEWSNELHIAGSLKWSQSLIWSSNISYFMKPEHCTQWTLKGSGDDV